MDAKPRIARWLVILCGLAIFILDLQVASGYALGIAYVPLLLTALWFQQRKATVVIAVVITSLTIVGFFAGPSIENGRLPMSATNRALSVLAIWITTAVILRHKHNEAELKGARLSRADLASRLIAAYEQERHRLARDLHDDFAQRLAVAAMHCEMLRNDPINASEKASIIKERLNLIENSFRSISHRLYPSILDTVGLVSAIDDECRSFERLYGIPVDFENPGTLPEPPPSDVGLCIYRICQEALNNIARHSKAKSAVVVVAKTDEGLRLVISDDGIGFNTKAPTESIGLLSMRERVLLVGGHCKVRSAPGAGCEISVFIPVAWSKREAA